MVERRYQEDAVKEAISGLIARPIQSKEHFVTGLVLVIPTLTQREARKRPTFEHSLRAATKVCKMEHAHARIRYLHAQIVPQVIDSWGILLGDRKQRSDPCKAQLLELCWQTIVFASHLQREDDSR